MMSTIYCGVDEAGRGPLCGPVFAAAVILPEEHGVLGLRDSKKLRPAKREDLAIQIRQHTVWGIGQADWTEIDRLNILQASFVAMHRALEALQKHPGAAALSVDTLELVFLVDGNRDPGLCTSLPFRSQSTRLIVSGDDIEAAISAASILAKTARDAWIRDWVRENDSADSYGLLGHMGYPTALHIQRIAELGPSPIHRHSFRVRALETKLEGKMGTKKGSSAAR